MECTCNRSVWPLYLLSCNQSILRISTVNIQISNVNKGYQSLKTNRLLNWLNKELVCYIRSRIIMINTKSKVHVSDIECMQPTPIMNPLFTRTQ